MTCFPLLLQVDARVLLRRLDAATLADIPDTLIDRWTAWRVRWIYLLGVWQLGQAGPAISRADPALLAEGRAALPHFTPADIAGSPFAITGTQVDASHGGDEALAHLRARLARRGLKLMLDFIPNHTAPDHPWVAEDPDLYVNGDHATLDADPRNWRQIGDRVIALGRDPYFDGWADTLQLDYANPRTQARMSASLAGIAARCDGVRADMAMLVLPDIIARTWQRPAADFWPAAIAQARQANPSFTLLAEVYWNLERALLDRGFDYTYDKTFYDAVVARDPQRIRRALAVPLADQSRMARFLENHDEPRAAALFDWPAQRAATAITFFVPGLRFLHDGQVEGAAHHLSMHLARAPAEPANPGCAAFHEAVLALIPHDGEFASLPPAPAWPNNDSHQSFILLLWRAAPRTLLVCINDAPTRGQCRVRLDLGPGPLLLIDQLSAERYVRADAELAEGLYLDLPAWGINVFDVGPPPKALPLETNTQTTAGLGAPPPSRESVLRTTGSGVMSRTCRGMMPLPIEGQNPCS